MKTLLFTLSALFLSYMALPLAAQENPYKKMMENSSERMIVIPSITQDSNISDNMCSIILDRLCSAIDASGELCSHDSDCGYILQFSVKELDKSIAGTVPPMVITKLQISLSILDDENIHATYIFNVKGAGETETASYDDACKSISFRNEAFSKFLSSAKKSVIEFYAQEIDSIIAEANRSGGTDEAMELLSRVPRFAADSWEKAYKAAASLSRASQGDGRNTEGDIVPLVTPPPIPHLPTLPTLKMS